MMIRKLSLILMLMVAAVCTACNRHGEKIVVEAGAFTIVREQQSYNNWNTGGTTEYYTYVVRYQKNEFKFPGLSFYMSSDGQATEITSNQIHYAYIVSQSPAALLVVAGDLSNDASWYLLRETPTGLHTEHIGFYSTGSDLEWLDGDLPVLISDSRELLTIEGGRWLWICSQSLLDLDSLHVYRLSSLAGSGDGAKFIAFSPDRRKMVRYDHYMDPNDFRVWHSVILENDIASGNVRSFAIDEQTMWFDSSEDIDRTWLEWYFEWRKENDASYVLHPITSPKPRPYHGRLEVETDTNGVQYHVPRLRFEHRQAAMDFIAGALGGACIFDEPFYIQMPPAATGVDDDSAPRPNVELSAGIGPLASADLDVDGKQLTVYFSESGLSIDNHDPAMNELVRKIASTLDAEFAVPAGQAWIIDISPNP